MVFSHSSQKDGARDPHKAQVGNIQREHIVDVPRWPPEKTDEELFELHNRIRDYQITHGSLIKLVRTDDGHNVLSCPIGVSMFPTWFPRACFEQALLLQETYNELYVNVAEDPEWLHDVLKGLIDSEPLARALWKIYEQVQKDSPPQMVSLGIFRSDYMLHGNQGPSSVENAGPSLKQVEFNNFSCAGGIHGNIATNMHHHLARVGCYQTEATSQTLQFSPVNLPKTNTLKSIVDTLALAHKTYADLRPQPLHELAILMPVQPYNVNICDERPIEYGLWDQEPPIPCFRAIFTEEILDRCSLDVPSKALLYQGSHPPSKTYEISVVYMRAGYDASEYADPLGSAARILLERSLAIKCPSLLSHLSTFKKVQQALADPSTLSRFLPDRDRQTRILQTFAPLYPLDTSPAGQQARSLALDPSSAANHVLKPSLEGGGHNIYGTDIPAFLHKTDQRTWPNFILMEKIEPPLLQNTLLSGQGIYRGPVVSELGVFGVVLWRRRGRGQENTGGGGGGGGNAEIIHNAGAAGWSFKTKARHVDEMSVIKGYGCFDTPYLV